MLKVILTTLFTISCSIGTTVANTKLHIEEVAIDEVFVVPVGYDSNDNIEIVIDGKLPNTCYELFQTKVIASKKTFKIKQLMRRKNLTECLPLLSDHQQPDHQQHDLPVQFSTIISLGELSPGKYRIEYATSHSLASQEAYKDFLVSQSSTERIDDHIYAPVSSAFIPELIYTTSDAQVILTGILASSCMVVNSDAISVERFENIFVIVPKLKIINEQPCNNFPRPLEQFVSLGAVKPGRYLIHVRSMTGRSVNKTFTVIDKSTHYNANYESLAN